MKVKYCFLPLLLFLFIEATAQDCASLAVSFSTSESRCVATGSITVNVSGGSGNYNYKAVGPVTTPTTSTNIITGLPPGYYSLYIKDLVTNCIKQVDSVRVTGSYSDPRFQLIKTDVGCSGSDGTISVFNQQFGRSPFTYTIVAPSPSGVGNTNTSGFFTGLISGEYSISLQDSCGGIQVRKITIASNSWSFDQVTVNRLRSDSASVVIKLKDNRGNVNTSGSAFNGFSYGVVRSAGDTVWKTSYSFNCFIGTKRNLIIVAKDNCGNIHSTPWSLPSSVRPSMGNVSLSNYTCSRFNVSVTSQNIANPLYCLYDNTNIAVACNNSGVFTNVSYGSYCIKITDVCYDTTISRCFTASHPLPAVAASVNITGKDCNGFTATITGQQNLTSPDYCLYTSANVLVGCNTTGIFSNVPYGSYCIKTHDACTDTLISRCFTVARNLPVLTSYTISGSDCSGFGVGVGGNNLDHALYCLYDSAGNVVTCDSSGNFTGIPHGQYCIRAITCTDTSNSICLSSAAPIPSVGNGVYISNKACSTFSAGIWGQVNLVNPEYCLYTSTDSLISCNTSGTFDGIPYGSYCIRIKNNCYDTVISRCFTEVKALPVVNATMQVLSTGCSTVSFQVSGSSFIDPTYCLYDEGNNLVLCNTTGIFNNQPYGRYCVSVRDGCLDTTITVCQQFKPAFDLSLATSKSCNLGNSFIDVQFTGGNSPYIINVYNPGGVLVYNTTTSTNPYRIELAGLPSNTTYKVVGRDNCGNRDSSVIVPDANVVTKTVTVRSKCPSSTWLNGAGDLVATTTSNYYPLVPQLIKKNGAAFVQSYSSVAGSVYTFADLEPAQYIIQYTQQNCNGKLYDTVTVSPYAYPTQGQSAIYQCDNNSFSLGADVQGGVTPYTFQIIGSMPSFPSINTLPQNSPVFNINTGTVYSLVRLRSIDACGNATLNDVSVLPLQNVSITASNRCFFQNTTLSVDSVPNATYYWYKKNSPTDSVLIGTGLNYNLPFFMPEEAGTYVCRMVVNNGCVTRLSSFLLDGNCNDAVLPVTVQLQGRTGNHVNHLNWNTAGEAGLIKYVVERKTGADPFRAIGDIALKASGQYAFDDLDAPVVSALYRLRLVYTGRSNYSNTVRLGGGQGPVRVFPNPVSNELHIQFAQVVSGYRLQLLSASGQLIFSGELTNTSEFIYRRKSNVQPGIYLVRLTSPDGITEIRKVVFE
jgi:hypothetical protein